MPISRLVTLGWMTKFALSCVLMASCKTPQSESLVRADEDEDGADVGPVANLSPKGGLLGSADSLPQDLGTLPRFKMTGNFPTSPAFQTSPPPTPDMAVLKGADATKAKAEA